MEKEFELFLPLMKRIDTFLEQGNKRGRLIVAIDGGSASGKTTLAAFLEKRYEDLDVFHMDDFFLTPELRTEQRLNEVGGNVDRERFEKEVLLPISKGEAVNYRRYICKAQEFSSPITGDPKGIIIVEGAYSMHPSLMKYYDFTVFLNIDSESQRERILKRNPPPLANRFFSEWIPLEKVYFEKTDIKNRCDLVIEV